MPERVVVSLSSIPPRFDNLRPTLDSLLAQDRPADAALLWVPRAYRRFPGGDGRLPEVLDGVTILRCDQGCRPRHQDPACLARVCGPGCQHPVLRR